MKYISLLAGVMLLFPVSAFSEDLDTSATVGIRGEDVYSSPIPDFTKALEGKLPGLIVVNQDGTPGAGTARMLVRGLGSYAEGVGTNTLKFFVDGFEVKSDYIDYLNAEEIESVQVLKDAAALALYGMSGANGVILITTRRGAASAPVISFQTRTGLQMPIHVVRPLGSLDYANLYNQAWSNDHGREWDPYYDFEAIGEYKNGTGIDVNWYDEVMKKTGSYTDALLSMRGGSDLAKYNVVLDYANQQGFLDVKNTDRTKNVSFVKYGVRTNIDMKLNKVLSAKVDISGRLEDRTRPNYDIYSLMNDIMTYPSNIYPVNDPLSTDPISTYSGTALYPNNPVASVNGTGWTTSRTKLLLANFRFREDLDVILPGLYMEQGFSFYSKTVGNTAKTSSYARYYNGVAQTSDQSTYLRSNGYWSSGKERWMQGNASIAWDRSFDEHSISAKLGAHISDYNGSGSQFYNWKYHYINYNGFVNYTFDNRYSADLGFSYFGSDAFAPGKRFHFYPTASFAWLASNEDFLKGNETVNNLKIRTSIGLSGAAESYIGIDSFTTDGRYLYQQYYGWTGNFTTGPGPVFDEHSGLRPLFKANPDLKPEQSLKANLGVDATLFGKLSVTADYFFDNRTNIITLDNTLMDYNGTEIFYSNIGHMINQGIDMHFVYNDKSGDLGYSVFGNLLFAKNKVLEMGEIPTKYSYNAATGNAYGVRMGLECIGFYESKDFDMDGELNLGQPVPLFGAVQPGDLKYKDRDGDGFIDDTDVIKIGEPAYPSAVLSLGSELNWKGFDFSVLFTGSFGGTVNLLDYPQWRAFENYGTAFEWAKGAWVFYPEAKLDTRDTATYPRLSTSTNDNNYHASSFWIRKNNWLRLQNIEFGYELSNIPAVRNVGLHRCRVYINAYNILTLSSLLWECKMDPQTTNYGYPAAQSVNIGLQLTF